MKVLFIGGFRDGTGWGKASQNYILALDRAGINVVPRPIRTCPTFGRHVDIPERILELEDNDESGCDVCIQHVLPDMMDYNGKFDQNIGVFMCESSHFRNARWAEYLNCMDSIWVSNHGMIEACEKSYIHKPIHVVPLCFDMSLYSQRYEKFEIKEIEGTFIFYAISEFRKRKNFDALLKAFHLEFGINEPVSLLIKSHVPCKPENESFREISKTCERIKTGLNLYPNNKDYHSEIILPQWMSDESIFRLHKTCDCYVSPSYGEAWGIPGFDAMAIGNPVILTKEGGPSEYVIDGVTGLLVDCFNEPAYMEVKENVIDNIWLGNENWKSVYIEDLRKAMRSIYENKELRKALSNNGIDRSYEFSYDNIGNKMKNILENPIDSKNHYDKKENIINLLKGKTCQVQ